MRKRSELIFSLLLVPVDYLALVAAFVAAYIYRVKIVSTPVAHPISSSTYLKYALYVLPIWILIFALVGLYNQSNLRGRLDEAGKVFVAVSGGVMVTLVFDFFRTNPLYPSKSVPIYAYLFGLILVLTGRIIVRSIQRSLFRFGIGVHNTIIVGSGEIAQQLVARLSPVSSGYRLLGCVDASRGGAKRMRGIPFFTSFEQVQSTFGRRQIDEIIQADSLLKPDEILELVTYAANHHIVYRFVPNQFGVFAIRSEMSTVAGMSLVEMKLTPLDGWGRILKRSLDFVASILGLVILSPFLLLLCAAMIISDPGPIFYRNLRLSRTGKEIRVYKFRSMRWKYCDGPNRPFKTAQAALKAMGHEELIPEFERTQKLTNDPRVTRIGRFLRRTSLDELPQLLNVIKGEMSLVGPRPIIPTEIDNYGEQKSAFLALKPGITGLWQVSGRSDLSYAERVKLDIYYVENWSLWLDLKILLRTVSVVLNRTGAY